MAGILTSVKRPAGESSSDPVGRLTHSPIRAEPKLGILAKLESKYDYQIDKHRFKGPKRTDVAVHPIL
jgi:hypothetical protein